MDEKTARRQEVIDAINDCGGMAVLAHPYWSLNTKEDVEALHGFSLLEIYNSVSDVHQSVRPYSGYLVDVLANDGYVLPLIATDDTHYYDGTDDTKLILWWRRSGSAEDILSGPRVAFLCFARAGIVCNTDRRGRKNHTRSVQPLFAYQLCYKCLLVKGSRVSRCEFNKCGIYDAGV